MTEELDFLPNELTVSNLSALSPTQSALQEERICEISELAYDAARFSASALSEGMEFYDAFAIISEGLDFGEYIVHSDSLSANVSRLRAYLKTLCNRDKIIFADLYTERLAEFGILPSEIDLLPVGDLAESFVYVKNSFADEAYEVFSQDFADPRVRYAADFRDAVARVVDGEVSYCLLPLEERGSRLPTVEEMIYRSDLKITSVTPVFGFDGSLDMKFALVSKLFAPFEYEADDDRYFEIRIPMKSDGLIAEVITAADSYFYSCHRVNTNTYHFEGVEQHSYSLIFKSRGSSFLKLLVYLVLFVPEFTPVGIYKNLE